MLREKNRKGRKENVLPLSQTDTRGLYSAQGKTQVKAAALWFVGFSFHLFCCSVSLTSCLYLSKVYFRPFFFSLELLFNFIVYSQKVQILTM